MEKSRLSSATISQPPHTRLMPLFNRVRKSHCLWWQAHFYHSLTPPPHTPPPPPPLSLSLSFAMSLFPVLTPSFYHTGECTRGKWVVCPSLCTCILFFLMNLVSHSYNSCALSKRKLCKVKVFCETMYDRTKSRGRFSNFGALGKYKHEVLHILSVNTSLNCKKKSPPCTAPVTIQSPGQPHNTAHCNCSVPRRVALLIVAAFPTIPKLNDGAVTAI